MIWLLIIVVKSVTNIANMFIHLFTYNYNTMK